MNLPTTVVSTPAGNPAPRRGPEPVSDADDVRKLSDTGRPIRLGFWVLVVGFGLFMAWAAFAPLEEGVSAPAVVAVESRRTTIQHVQGGVIDRLLVKDGSMVKKGDVLVELDPSIAVAQFQGIRQNYLSQRALEGRLVAESSGAASISFHPDLLKGDDPIAKQNMSIQQQLFDARRAGERADISALQAAVTSTEVQRAGLRDVIAAKRAQQAIQTQQLGSVRALADEGFAPRNQTLQLEQAGAELRSTLAELESNVDRLQSTSAEARQRLAQRRQEYIKESSGALADLRREVAANQEKLSAMSTELDRMRIRSPVEGQVIGLNMGGLGSVVQPGQHLMDILPANEATVLDVKLPPQVIDRVTVGNEVEVRFSAFSSQPNLVVLGKLISLSGDAVTESVNGLTSSHYVGKVELTPAGLRALGNNVVLPGMMAEVLIKSGERSLLTYLLHPLLKRVSTSMTEQ